MDSPVRRSRSQLPPLQQEEQEQLQSQPKRQESELPPGTRALPYPSGEGHMIIRDGFNHA